MGPLLLACQNHGESTAPSLQAPQGETRPVEYVENPKGHCGRGRSTFYWNRICVHGTICRLKHCTCKNRRCVISVVFRWLGNPPWAGWIGGSSSCPPTPPHTHTHPNTHSAALLSLQCFVLGSSYELPFQNGSPLILLSLETILFYRGRHTTMNSGPFRNVLRGLAIRGSLLFPGVCSKKRPLTSEHSEQFPPCRI